MTRYALKPKAKSSPLTASCASMAAAKTKSYQNSTLATRLKPTKSLPAKPSPDHQPAIPKAHWSKNSKTSASAVQAPKPPSSTPSKPAATSKKATAKASHATSSSSIITAKKSAATSSKKKLVPLVASSSQRRVGN